MNNQKENAVNILIAEDSQTQAEQLRYILEKKGYRVFHAKNGNEGIRLATECDPTMIISDIVMPEMDGYEFCRHVKSEKGLKNVPFVLLTALSDPQDVIRGLECGADNFFSKPYDEDFLLARVQYFLLNLELRKNATTSMGIEIFFSGRKHYLTAERMQIIDLLVSSFETAVQKNTELKHRNVRLEEALSTITTLETNYRTLLDIAVEAFIVVDSDNIVVYVNPAAETLFHKTMADFVGNGFDFHLNERGKREVEIKTPDGRTVIAEMQVKGTNWEGKDASLISLHDITGIVMAREELRTMSFKDDLTGLYNRRGFVSTAEHQLELAKRKKNNMLLFFIDLDRMKWINDVMGHNEGDKALMSVACILNATFRKSDIIARFGGDEFVVLVTEALGNCVVMLLDRLQQNLSHHNKVIKRSYRLSFSIGISYFDCESPRSVQELIREADAAMYEEKRRKQEELLNDNPAINNDSVGDYPDITSGEIVRICKEKKEGYE